MSNSFSLPVKSAADEIKEYHEFLVKPLPQRLRERAAACRRRADQFKGCTWVGTFWPGTFAIQEAADLEEAADLLEKQK